MTLPVQMRLLQQRTAVYKPKRTCENTALANNYNYSTDGFRTGSQARLLQSPL